VATIASPKGKYFIKRNLHLTQRTYRLVPENSQDIIMQQKTGRNMLKVLVAKKSILARRRRESMSR